MNRTRWLKTGFVSVMVLLGLATAPPALAAVGDARWCPLLATAYTAPIPQCEHYGTLQEAVNAARSDGRPGNIYALGLKTFTENVVADKLTGVRFVGNANGAGATTISGSLTISNSRVILVTAFNVTGGIKVLNAKGPFQVLTNVANLDITGGKFTSGSANDGTTTLTMSDGLLVASETGNISLTKVTATKAIASGATLIPSAGFTTAINQSKFTKNGNLGLLVIGSGPIVLTDVSATQNASIGALLVAIGASAVVVTTNKTRLNHFDKNADYGLEVVNSGTGSIVLTDVTANKNQTQGAVLTASSGPITVTTAKSKGNQFNNNIQNGLIATTTGAITLVDVSASKNGGGGAQVTNSSAPASSLVVATSRSKRNSFDKNTLYGLQLVSDGPVTAANISASRNGQFGAQIINSGAGNTMILSSTKGRNTFDRNGQFGLILTSGANVTVGDISASRNVLYGAQLIASPGAVSLNSSASKLNLFDRNSQYGLVVFSTTGQTLTDVSASKNGLFGAFLSTGGGIITLLTNHSKQNLFSNNTQFGLQGAAAGGLDIHNTTASKNGAGGTFDGFNLSTLNSSATLTCSTAKSNTGDGISASLGTGTLFLKSTVPTGNGTNINLVGVGPTSSTVGCPS